jgi:hypothetical protein
VLFDFGQVVQIYRAREFDDIEGSPINDLAPLCERNKQVLPLFGSWNDEA